MVNNTKVKVGKSSKQTIAAKVGEQSSKIGSKRKLNPQVQKNQTPKRAKNVKVPKKSTLVTKQPLTKVVEGRIYFVKTPEIQKEQKKNDSNANCNENRCITNTQAGQSSGVATRAKKPKQGVRLDQATK